MVELRAEAILNETYQLVAPLGRGGMGEVWRARHLRLPKEVALKVLSAAAQENDEAVRRFRREAEICSRLGHPNIVQILDFNTLEDGRSYIVMELLQGEDLRQRLRRGSVTLQETLDVLTQVAQALHVAHRAGVVHRDLKPENIFLCHHEEEERPQVKILDFGISKVQGSQTMMTQDRMVLGTPGYMAPEQAMGRNADVDQRTDQFALAAIGYEMLSGRGAFSGETLAEVVYKVVHEQPPPLRDTYPSVPNHIARAIDRAMNKDPTDRFADVKTFCTALAGPDAAAAAAPQRHGPPVAAAPGGAPSALPQTVVGTSSPPPAALPQTVVGTSSPPPAALPQTVVGTAAEPAAAPPPTAAPPPKSLVVAAVVGGVLALGIVVVAALFLLRAPADVTQASAGTAAASSGAHASARGRTDATPATPAKAPAVDAAAPAKARKPKPRARKTGAKPRERPTPPRPPRPAAVPTSLRAQLRRARQALARGNYAAALRLARGTLATKRTKQAYAVMAMAYCGKRDLGMARAMRRNVSGALRRRVTRFCRKRGINFY